jgi:hypothetical protein
MIVWVSACDEWICWRYVKSLSWFHGYFDALDQYAPRWTPDWRPRPSTTETTYSNVTIAPSIEEAFDWLCPFHTVAFFLNLEDGAN